MNTSKLYYMLMFVANMVHRLHSLYYHRGSQTFPSYQIDYHLKMSTQCSLIDH
ncbi:unnamed protein product [Onchocerca flexuosa]|uniref:Secreted protein n=1 Tax=Onchocerca flexuosa TaxID=387005 RepID=A0A183GYH8_9BILA|nr:unnamed protein product [Onchocerca flexuosa]